jgi:hypothetical protein
VFALMPSRYGPGNQRPQSKPLQTGDSILILLYNPQPVSALHPIHRGSQFWCVQYCDQFRNSLVGIAYVRFKMFRKL